MFSRQINHFQSGGLLLAACLLVVPQAFAQHAAAVATPKTASTAASHSKEPVEKSADVSPILIDSHIPEDLATKKMLDPYTARIRALDLVIGRLEGDLRKGGIGAGSLGNFVADSMLSRASRKPGRQIVLSVTNNGGLRRSAIPAGEVKARDIFELMPFENALVEVDLNGEQLLRLLHIVLTGNHAQSGARIKYLLNPPSKPEVIKATLTSKSGVEESIRPQAVYTVVTTDYLVKIASGEFAIFQEGKNIRPLGITLRDSIIDYIKAETAAGRALRPRLDGRFKAVRQMGRELTNDQ